MASEIRVNSLSSRTGLSTVTFTDTGPIFSGITTFQDNSGFNVGTGGSIFSPASNTVTLGTNNAERLRITSAGLVDISGGVQVSENITPTSGAGLELFREGGGGGQVQAYDRSGSAWLPLILKGSTQTFHTNGTERLRIDSGGRIAQGGKTPTNHGSPNLLLWGADPTLHISATGSTANTSFAGIKFAVAGGSTGDYSKAGIFVQRQDSYNDLDMIFAFRSSNDATGVSVSDEKMRINSDGKVGVGENSPDRLLHLKAASSTAYSGGSDTADYNFLKIENTTNDKSAGIFFQIGGNGEGAITATEVADGNTDICFQNRGGGVRSEKLRITSGGKIGVGVASPSEMMEISNTGSTGSQIQLRDTSTGTGAGDGLRIGYNGSGGQLWNFESTYLRFATNNVERLRITSDGKLLIGSDTGSVHGNRLLQIGKTDRSETYVSIVSSTSGESGLLFADTTTNDTGGYRGQIRYHHSDDSMNFRTGATERLRITSAGYVLKSDTPAFKCKLSGATGANFTGVLVFNSVQYNIGSHYNSSNGRFTAPVDGRYLFAWYTNMERAGGNGSFYAEWYINNNAQGNRMYTHHSGAWEQIGGTVIFDLNANDYVHIQAMTSGNWDGGSYGSYSGYLLG